MSLTLRLNGREYENFTEARVERDIERVCSTFSFVATARRANFLPIRDNDEVEILADGQVIMTGVVDNYHPSANPQQHAIQVKGRSRTRNLVDCTFESKTSTPVTFANLATSVAGNFNIDVVDEVGDNTTFDTGLIASIGQKAFEFLEPFARKRQSLLTDDSQGRLVITRGSTESSSYSLKNLYNKPLQNNLLSVDFDKNVSGLYGKYICHSQLNLVDLGGFVAGEQAVNQVGEAIDSDVDQLRVYDFYAEEATSVTELEQRAQWELALRRARAFNYSAKVQGHSYNGEVWKHNLLYRVDDDFSQLYGMYLCGNIVYHQSLEEGSTTTLNLKPANAYSLQAIIDKLNQDNSARQGLNEFIS